MNTFCRINQIKRSTHYCLSEPPQHCRHKQRKLNRKSLLELRCPYFKQSRGKRNYTYLLSKQRCIVFEFDFKVSGTRELHKKQGDLKYRATGTDIKNTSI